MSARYMAYLGSSGERDDGIGGDNKVDSIRQGEHELPPQSLHLMKRPFFLDLYLLWAMCTLTVSEIPNDTFEHPRPSPRLFLLNNIDTGIPITLRRRNKTYVTDLS